jgi:hypothetical protein
MTSVKKPTRQDDAALAHLDEELARWTAKGAITTQQAEAIRHIEEANEPAPAGTRIPLVAQALGFLGGALAIIAGIVATSRFWDELSTPARLGLVGTVAVLLVVAGRIVRRGDEPALENLGSFLWVLALGCTAFWTGIAAVDVVKLEGADVATAIGVVCLVAAAGLWQWRPAPLQQVATFAALALTVGSIAGHVEHVGGLFIGIVLWGLAVVWLVLAWLGVVSPAPIAFATGALLAIVGGGVVGGEARFGDVLAVATVVAILAASVPTRSMVLLWMGVLGVFQTLPTAITRHFGDSLGAPLILFLVGLSLIGVAVIASRLAPEIRSAPPRLARMSQRTIATGMLSVVVVIVGLTMGVTNIPPVPTYPSLQASPDLTLTGSSRSCAPVRSRVCSSRRRAGRRRRSGCTATLPATMGRAASRGATVMSSCTGGPRSRAHNSPRSTRSAAACWATRPHATRTKARPRACSAPTERSSRSRVTTATHAS